MPLAEARARAVRDAATIAGLNAERESLLARIAELEDETRSLAGIKPRHRRGLAGALLANHTNFISPALMHWTRSGDLIVMVALGGLGSLFGPVIGAVTFLLLEEGLSRLTQYPDLILGPILLVVAIYLNGGIEALLEGRRRG